MLSARIPLIFSILCSHHAFRLRVKQHHQASNAGTTIIFSSGRANRFNATGESDLVANLTSSHNNSARQALKPGALLGGNYELSAPIGSGAYGEIWRATDKATGREVAVKLFTKANMTDEALADESLGCVVQRMLRQKAEAMGIQPSRFNDCLADCLGQTGIEALQPWRADTTHCSEGAGERPFLVLELLESMVDLCDADKVVSSDENALIVSQVLEGVMVMGTSGVRHGDGFYPAVSHTDMHGKNIMVKQEASRIVVTIIDFGLVKVFSGKSLNGGLFFPNDHLLAGKRYPDFLEEVVKVMFEEKVTR